MKYKLYKAVDVQHGEVSGFLLREDGHVAVTGWRGDADYKISLSRLACKEYSYDGPSRIDDAINPVLMAEFEV